MAEAADARSVDQPSSKTRHVLYSGLIGAFGGGLLTVASLFLLEPSVRGRYVSVCHFPSLIGQLVGLSVHLVVPHARQARRSEMLRRAMNALTVCAMSCAVLGLPILALIWALKGTETWGSYVLAAGNLFVGGIAFSAMQIVYLIFGSKGFFTVSVVPPGLYAIAAVILVALRIHSVGTFDAIFFAAGASGVLACLFALHATQKRDPRQAGELMAMFRSTWSPHGNTLATYALYRGDLLASAIALSTTSLGMYSTATSISEVAWVVPQAVAMTAWRKAGFGHGRSQEIAREMRLATIAAGVACAGLAAALGLVFRSYGAAAGIGFMLAPGVGLMAAHRVGAAHLAGLGRHEAVRSYLGITAVIACIGYPLSALFFGTTGLALCCTVVYCIAGLGAFRAVRSESFRLASAERRLGRAV